MNLQLKLPVGPLDRGRQPGLRSVRASTLVGSRYICGRCSRVSNLRRFDLLAALVLLSITVGDASAALKTVVNNCANFRYPNGQNNPPTPPIIGHTVDEVDQQCESQCDAYPEFECTLLGDDQQTPVDVPQYGYFATLHYINVDLARYDVTTGAFLYDQIGHYMEADEYVCKDGWVQTRSVDPAVVPIIGCENISFYLAPPTEPDYECEGDPCHPATGGVTEKETDIAPFGETGIRFDRYYGSVGAHNSSGSLAPGWRHTYDRRLNESTLGVPAWYRATGGQSNLYDTPGEACQSGWLEVKNVAWGGALTNATAALVSDQDCRIQQNGKVVAHFSIRPNASLFAPLPVPNTVDTWISVSRPDGAVYRFEKVAGDWTDPFAPEVSLLSVGGEWLFTDADGTVERYDGVGNLVSITTRSGRVQTLSYDDADRLARVEAATGEYIEFGYDTLNRVSTVADHAGRVWTYRYGAAGNLEYVDNPDVTTRQYHYEDPNFAFALTGITDERGIRSATWEYNADGKVIASERASGIERVDLTYNVGGTTTVQGSRGTQRTYHFAPQRGRLAVTSITGDLCTTCTDGDKKQRNYDANGYLAGYTDWSDSVTKLGNYDSKGQYGCKVKGISATDASTGECAFAPVASPAARPVDYTYDPRFLGKITSITEPSVNPAGQ